MNTTPAFRYKIIEALRAEGVETGVWQRFILPAMAVFQAKNGYGKGCPGSAPMRNRSITPWNAIPWRKSTATRTRE